MKAEAILRGGNAATLSALCAEPAFQLIRERANQPVHSLYSDDGEFTPGQLVEMCHEAGVKIMAIADHNWVKAIDEAKKKAEELKIKYIPAIEIDCTYKEINLHVLGFIKF